MMATNNACDEPTSAIGKVLQGQGIGFANNFSTATYPSTATGTGKILRADGTNWVPSTATFPDTAGTSGNVLTSDGTNWSSQPPPGGTGSVLSVSGTLSNSQIKNLNASPVTIITAPGIGKVLGPLFIAMTMNYGGTNVFTAGAGQTIKLYYSTIVNIKTILTNADIVSSSSQYGYSELLFPPSYTLTSFANTPLTLYNPSGSEISGNAANNNTMSYLVFYYVMSP